MELWRFGWTKETIQTYVLLNTNRMKSLSIRRWVQPLKIRSITNGDQELFVVNSGRERHRVMRLLIQTGLVRQFRFFFFFLAVQTWYASFVFDVSVALSLCFPYDWLATVFFSCGRERHRVLRLLIHTGLVRQFILLFFFGSSDLICLICFRCLRGIEFTFSIWLAGYGVFQLLLLAFWHSDQLIQRGLLGRTVGVGHLNSTSRVGMTLWLTKTFFFSYDY